MVPMPMYNVGVIAGNFDVIHPGYINMFKECKQYCSTFLILLHTDPSIERPEKLKPILSIDERTEMLLSIKNIDGVYTYTTESDLLELLKGIQPDIRFLGDDYRGRTYTGFELNIPIHYLDRSHGWSTTKFKKEIAKTINTMPKDKCILCGKDSPYEMDVNIDYRNGYIEGTGQLCEHCWDEGTNRESMLIPVSTIKNTPNDMELGKKVRSIYYKLTK